MSVLKVARVNGAPGWLLRHAGNAFQLLLFVDAPESLSAATRAALAALADAPIPVHTLLISATAGAAPAGTTLLVDAQGLAARRFDARVGTAYLLRRIEAGSWTISAPIGLYFARLWYDEALYPVVWTVEALGRMRHIFGEAVDR